MVVNQGTNVSQQVLENNPTEKALLEQTEGKREKVLTGEGSREKSNDMTHGQS